MGFGVGKGEGSTGRREKQGVWVGKIIGFEESDWGVKERRA